jgi:SanA protein
MSSRPRSVSTSSNGPSNSETAELGIVSTMKHRFFRLLVFMAAMCILCIMAANFLVGYRFQADCYDSADDIPERSVIVVLGAHPKSWYLKKRLDAAAELYLRKKGVMVLVSGGSDDTGYNEATAMKKMLVERGVPEAAIVCDPHGNRTLDSMVRTRETFGYRKVVIVSQRFHNPRALYFAHFCGLDAVAFNAETPPYPKHWQIELRETAARCLALWHVHVTGERPIVEQASQ